MDLRYLTFTAMFTLWLVAACDRGGTDPPTTGTIEVIASTTGDDLDPDGIRSRSGPRVSRWPSTRP